jgi:hypothetical protein
LVLGVSLNTLRRKIASGEIRAERVSRPQGHVWRVHLDGQHETASTAQHADQHPEQDAGSTLQQPAVEIQRAEVMASFLTPLLQQAMQPLVDELSQARRQMVEQAERLGAVQAELTQAKERILALEAPKAEPVAVEPAAADEGVSGPATRPWWRFWFG